MKLPIYLFFIMLMPLAIAAENCTQDQIFRCLDNSDIVTKMCTDTGYVETNATCPDGTPTVIKEGGPANGSTQTTISMVKTIYFVGFLLLLVLIWWLLKRKGEKQALDVEEKEFEQNNTKQEGGQSP